MPIFYLDTGSIDRLEISSSLLVSGALVVSGSLQTSGGGLTGSLLGTASLATTASYVTGSIFFGTNAALSASFATSASWAPGGSTLAGGQDKYIARWDSATSITTSSLYEGDNNNLGINVTTFNATNPEALRVSGSTFNVISGEANLDNYAQLNVVNKGTGTVASSDIVATNNAGTELGNYVDLGINGSNYAAGFIGAANDGYLYNTGSNFLIGNTTTGVNANLKFFAGNNATIFPIVVTGSVAILTGSLQGTASWADNATNATTAATASSVGRLTQSVIITGSLVVSGSAGTELIVLGEQIITGSLRISNGIIAQTITGSFTGSLSGSLSGTASWSDNARTASFITPLNQNVIITGSVILSSSVSTQNELTVLGQTVITGSLIVSGTFGSGVFSKGGTIADYSNLIAISASYFIWRAPYSASVVALYGLRDTGSATTAVNARRSSSAGYALHTASNIILTSDNTWTRANAVQNTAYAPGDSLEIIVSGSNNRQVAVQIDFIKL